MPAKIHAPTRMPALVLSATLLLATALAAPVALAHGKVQNPAVQARMAAMTQIGGAMKSLGGMAKGQSAFDADTVQAALDTIAAQAARVPDLFAAPETDPKSEALPAIWQAYDDFTQKAEALQTVAERAQVAGQADLVPTLSALGTTCKACHRQYRE